MGTRLMRRIHEIRVVFAIDQPLCLVVAPQYCAWSASTAAPLVNDRTQADTGPGPNCDQPSMVTPP